MSITAQLKQFYIKALTGMNNLVEDLDMKEKWVDIAQNCRFEEEPGAVDKRTPVTYYNSTTMGSGAYGVTGLFRFYTSGGVSKFISIHDTSAYVGTDSTGSWTAIRTGLTAGKRMAFAVYRDLLMGSNGYDNPWVYDGASDNVTWELGACKSLISTSATGSLEASQVYSYQVAITVSGSTHICGSISNAVSSGTAQCIEVSNIPLGPSGTTNRLLYRIEGDETVTTHGNYDLVATIADNTTTTYTDTIGDASLGATMGAVTDDMPLGSIPIVHRERFFLSGDPSYPNKIYYADPWLPHFIQQTTNTTYMEISPEDGDEISGIPIQLGTMICIKKNTIRKLHITSASSGADPSTWYAEDPVAWTGCPAQWSVTQTPFGIVFLGWDHWYLFDGAVARPIIDEFDVKDILDANYSDVVGFFHNGIMLAAYPDKTIANQYHDRIMRYNFKRQALSYDEWNGANIKGANCFAAKTGDDETGELYYGDSQKGYVVKEKESEQSYQLKTKTECNAGTKTDVFIGGTEASPYIEIGSTTSASTIPDGICIFWDQTGTTPGAGWTEITGIGDKYIKISATAATTAAASSHTHTMSGSLLTSSAAGVNGGDSDSSGGLVSQHTHTASGTSGSGSAGPRYTKYRIFKADSCATTEFPDGAIIMWDQESAPTGWWTVASNVGYYVQQGSAGLASANPSSHSHAFSYSSGSFSESGASVGGSNGSKGNHSHTVSGTLASKNQDDWELDYVALHFIKKVGESDTWDGSAQFAYALDYGAGAPTGWTAVSATYEGSFLKIGSAASTTTGTASNAAHTHIVGSGSSGTSSALWGGTYHTTGILDDHTHSQSLAAASGDSGDPASITFRMYKMELGKMKDYNAAIATHQGTGTWTSPSQEINSETLSKMFWNESLTGSDNAVVHTRVGVDKATCEAAAWSAALSDPNGSTIASTADVWLQYKIEFTATDTTTSNPKVYFVNGYVVKYTYLAGATNAETSVNWKYAIGWRNFDDPMVDKIFKKIATFHKGEIGSFSIEWETENTDTANTFTIDLTQYPKNWDSFFPSTAMGKELNVAFYKNDLYDFQLKETKGLYSPQDIIL